MKLCHINWNCKYNIILLNCKLINPYIIFSDYFLRLLISKTKKTTLSPVSSLLYHHNKPKKRKKRKKKVKKKLIGKEKLQRQFMSLCGSINI